MTKVLTKFPKEHPYPDVLVRKEAASFVRAGIRTLDYLVATGQIPHFRVGKRGVRFRKSTLEKWIEKQEKGS